MVAAGPDGAETPTLIGERVRLRRTVQADVAQRRNFGQKAEISRAFGGTINTDGPMSMAEAEASLACRPEPGPQWVIADADDRFPGTCRLAPMDRANGNARFAIGLFDIERLGQGLGTEAHD